MGNALPPIDISPFRRSGSRQLEGWLYSRDPGYGPPPPGWTPPELREWWIYFIQGDDGGPVKIGITVNLVARAGELQVGYPFGALRFVGLLRAPRRTEKELHARFKALHLRGEWFRPEPILVDYVRALPLPEVRK